MAQDFGSIGQASAELERVAAEHQGWGDTPLPGPRGDTPDEPIAEMTDPTDFSFWGRRANLQTLGSRGMVTNWAGHEQEPAAAAVRKEQS